MRTCTHVETHARTKHHRTQAHMRTCTHAHVCMSTHMHTVDRHKCISFAQMHTWARHVHDHMFPICFESTRASPTGASVSNSDLPLVILSLGAFPPIFLSRASNDLVWSKGTIFSRVPLGYEGGAERGEGVG